MGFFCLRDRRVDWVVCVEIVVTMAVLMLGASAIGGCGQSLKDRQEDYRSEYVEIVNAFQAEVAKEDAKAQELVEGNNLAGLIKLNVVRIENISRTFDDISALSAPGELRRVHAYTLYYLMALVDQMEAQTAFAEAVLSGKPSGDLQQITESAALRAQQLGGELALELQKANIEIEAAPEEPIQPETSAPVVTPGANPQ